MYFAGFQTTQASQSYYGSIEVGKHRKMLTFVNIYAASLRLLFSRSTDPFRLWNNLFLSIFSVSGCPPARLSRSKCSPRNAFIQHEILRYWVKEQCQCKGILKRRSWVCDCAARYPPQQREFCHPRGHSKVIEVEKWINVGRNCKRIVERSENAISK